MKKTGKYCAYCRSLQPSDHAYCYRCGQKFTEKRCPNCDQLLPEEQRFCNSCMYDFQTISPLVEQAMPRMNIQMLYGPPEVMFRRKKKKEDD